MLCITLISFSIPDRDTGNRYRMKDIRQMVKDDPAYQNLSRTEEDELKGELIASREEKKLGARPTNRSAAQDYRRQLESLNDQVSKYLDCLLILTFSD